MNDAKRYLEEIFRLPDDTPSDDVRRTYDAWAATYDTELVDENGYTMPARAAELLAAVAPELGDAPVLDVGCGTGLSGLALKAKGIKVIDGCDFSAGMREVAAKRGIYRHLFHADLNAPPTQAAENSYAAAVAVGVFANGHLNEIALDEIVRCVRPGAPICVTINERFWETGVLKGAIERLEASGAISVRERIHGPAGNEAVGWVFLLEKAS